MVLVLVREIVSEILETHDLVRQEAGHETLPSNAAQPSDMEVKNDSYCYVTQHGGENVLHSLGNTPVLPVMVLMGNPESLAGTSGIEQESKNRLEAQTEVPHEGNPESLAGTSKISGTKQKNKNRLEAQTEVPHEDIDSEASPQVQRNISLKKEKQSLKEEIRVMQQKFRRVSLTSTFLDQNKTVLYTGLPSLRVFKWLVKLICGCLKSFNDITKPDQLLLTLVKLRLDLSTLDIAYRFSIPRNTVYDIIEDAVPKMAEKLKFLISWPCKEELKENMPSFFKPQYKNCSIIVDCFEFLIEEPLRSTAVKQTWSDIKHHHTIKCLLGITPHGSVSYVSQCWGGSISDRELALKSGLLNNIYLGDMVMTRRDFLISKELTEIGAKIEIPEFMHSVEDLVHDGLELSSPWIFVENAFERIKMFKILSHVLPLYLLSSIDEILTCCAALSNLQPSLLEEITQ